MTENQLRQKIVDTAVAWLCRPWNTSAASLKKVRS